MLLHSQNQGQGAADFTGRQKVSDPRRDAKNHKGGLQRDDGNADGDDAAVVSPKCAAAEAQDGSEGDGTDDPRDTFEAEVSGSCQGAKLRKGTHDGGGDAVASADLDVSPDGGDDHGGGFDEEGRERERGRVGEERASSERSRRGAAERTGETDVARDQVKELDGTVLGFPCEIMVPYQQKS